MPHWWPSLLLFIFATHMPFFALRWWHTREPRFLATTITFSLLIVTYALRVFAAELSLGGVPAYWWVRIPAWGAALISLTLFLRAKLRST